LNHFLYGFRFSHYLFLPQIFKNEGSSFDQTPHKFGVVVADANFLNNTGHDFIIIFIAVAVLIICKMTQLIISKMINSGNKVQNY
jgi:hypothetical protein